MGGADGLSVRHHDLVNKFDAAIFIPCATADGAWADENELAIDWRFATASAAAFA